MSLIAGPSREDRLARPWLPEWPYTGLIEGGFGSSGQRQSYFQEDLPCPIEENHF